MRRGLNDTWQSWSERRAALYNALPGLAEALVLAFRRFATPVAIIAIVAGIATAGTFVWTQWPAPLGVPPLAATPLGVEPLAATPLGVEPLAAAPIESRPSALASPAPSRPPVTEQKSNSPARPERRVEAASTQYIQRLLNRYRDAFSTLDVTAVRAIWPSVDTRALRMAFDRLAEHNLDYSGCKISMGDARAEAVCSGIAQSLGVGERTTRTTTRRWQFVLTRSADRWLIASVDTR